MTSKKKKNIRRLKIRPVQGRTMTSTEECKKGEAKRAECRGEALRVYARRKSATATTLSHLRAGGASQSLKGLSSFALGSCADEKEVLSEDLIASNGKHRMEEGKTRGKGLQRSQRRVLEYEWSFELRCPKNKKAKARKLTRVEGSEEQRRSWEGSATKCGKYKTCRILCTHG